MSWEIGDVSFHPWESCWDIDQGCHGDMMGFTCIYGESNQKLRAWSWELGETAPFMGDLSTTIRSSLIQHGKIGITGDVATI